VESWNSEEGLEIRILGWEILVLCLLSYRLLSLVTYFGGDFGLEDGVKIFDGGVDGWAFEGLDHPAWVFSSAVGGVHAYVNEAIGGGDGDILGS
jgi:hypothetical protein